MSNQRKVAPVSNPYPPNSARSNIPTIAALGSVVMLMLMMIGAVVILARDESLDESTTPLVITLLGVVVSAVPALISAAFSERASKDIRNGTLVEKSRQGAAAALEQHGPEVVRAAATRAIDEAQVMTRTGPVVTAELIALTSILDRLTTNAGKTS